MRNTAWLFLFVLLLSCSRVTVSGEPVDAGPLADAFVPLLDALPRADARPPLDAAARDAAGCTQFTLSDLPRGYIGEMALVEPLGTLTAEACLDQDCEPRRLYVGDQGLGVEGTSVDGDGVSGLERVTLRLDSPAHVGYHVYRGVNNNADLGVYHHVSAYLAGEQVLDMLIDAQEYEMAPMAAADEVVWSGAVVGADARSFADAFTLEWASVCPPEPESPGRSRSGTSR
jgi:hypothetical protein